MQLVWLDATGAGAAAGGGTHEDTENLRWAGG